MRISLTIEAGLFGFSRVMCSKLRVMEGSDKCVVPEDSAQQRPNGVSRASVREVLY